MMTRRRIWWRSFLGGRAFLFVCAPLCYGATARLAVGTRPLDRRPATHLEIPMIRIAAVLALMLLSVPAFAQTKLFTIRPTGSTGDQNDQTSVTYYVQSPSDTSVLTFSGWTVPGGTYTVDRIEMQFSARRWPYGQNSPCDCSRLRFATTVLGRYLHANTHQDDLGVYVNDFDDRLTGGNYYRKYVFTTAPGGLSWTRTLLQSLTAAWRVEGTDSGATVTEFWIDVYGFGGVEEEE